MLIQALHASNLEAMPQRISPSKRILPHIIGHLLEVPFWSLFSQFYQLAFKPNGTSDLPKHNDITVCLCLSVNFSLSGKIIEYHLKIIKNQLIFFMVNINERLL